MSAETVRDGTNPTTEFPDQAQIRRHIERHVGQVEGVARDETGVAFPIDLLWVPASPTRQFHTLVTSGMSRSAMRAPRAEWEFAELCLLLPPQWPLEPEAWSHGGGDWPVQWLKRLARLPHETESWLGFGHTVPNGEVPLPFAPDTQLSSWLLLPPVSLPQRFSRLMLPDKRVLNFWCLVALHEDELKLKVAKNTTHLLGQFGRRGVQDILDLSRPSVLQAAPLGLFSRFLSRKPETPSD